MVSVAGEPAVTGNGRARPYNPIMEEIIVTGGNPLKGSVAVLGAKNAVLKHMVAMLLAPGTHRLHNVPGILDVAMMGRVLDHIGARCSFDGHDLTVEIRIRLYIKKIIPTHRLWIHLFVMIDLKNEQSMVRCYLSQKQNNIAHGSPRPIVIVDILQAVREIRYT